MCLLCFFSLSFPLSSFKMRKIHKKIIIIKTLFFFLVCRFLWARRCLVILGKGYDECWASPSLIDPVDSSDKSFDLISNFSDEISLFFHIYWEYEEGSLKRKKIYSYRLAPLWLYIILFLVNTFSYFFFLSVEPTLDSSITNFWIDPSIDLVASYPGPRVYTLTFWRSCEGLAPWLAHVHIEKKNIYVYLY